MAVFACGLWFDRACHECRPYACEGETKPRSSTPITDACKPHTPPPVDPDACYPYSCSMDAWDADGDGRVREHRGHDRVEREVRDLAHLVRVHEERLGVVRVRVAPGDVGREHEADADAGEDARAWTTDEGVQMLTPGRDDAPVTEAVECPDGSLRIGHPAGDAGAEGREALCAEPRGR